MSDEVTDTLRIRELRLVDKDGSDRAILSTGEDGTVTLAFVDGSANPRLRLGLSEGRVVVEMGRGEGRPSVSISVEKDGHVLMEGADKEGVERVRLQLKGNGSHTELSFSEKNRHPRMIIMAEDKGPAGLFILDQHGKALFSTTP